MQLRHRKWSVLVLASILLLGNMGLSSNAFADEDDDDHKNDKLVSLEILYTVGSPGDKIVITQKNGNEIISKLLVTGDETITIIKSDFSNNKFKSKIFLTIFGTEISEEIHTSNSQILFIGQTFGDFKIVDILTEDGNNFLGIKKSKKNKVLTGEGPPIPGLGKIGDLYFDNFDELVAYVKIANNTWEERGVLGAGATGATGAPGDPGVDGMKGTTGPPGVDGMDGSTGPIGATGADGTTGAPGATGTTGAPGARGTTGPPGTGADGTTGAPGLSSAPQAWAAVQWAPVRR